MGSLQSLGRCSVNTRLVTDIRSLDPEDDILGDIGGVIRYALQAAADHQRIQGLRSEMAFGAHDMRQSHVRGAIHAIDSIVHAEHGLGHLRICLDERLQ